jgi:hypothetical protein
LAANSRWSAENVLLVYFRKSNAILILNSTVGAWCCLVCSWILRRFHSVMSWLIWVKSLMVLSLFWSSEWIPKCASFWLLYVLSFFFCWFWCSDLIIFSLTFLVRVPHRTCTMYEINFVFVRKGLNFRDDL